MGGLLYHDAAHEAGLIAGGHEPFASVLNQT